MSKKIPSDFRSMLGLGVAAVALVPPAFGITAGSKLYEGWDDAPVPPASAPIMIGSATSSTTSISHAPVTIYAARQDMVTGQEYKTITIRSVAWAQGPKRI